MIYPPNQKPPIWAIDPGIVAYNCQKYSFPHPILAMPMWEGAGNLARDYGGRVNHGSLIGQPEWTKEGLDFNGTSDRVDVGLLKRAPIGANPRTITFKFRADNFGTDTNRTLVTYATGGSLGGIWIFAEDGAISVGFAGHRLISPKAALSTGVWYRATIVVPPGAVNTGDTLVYIDSVNQSLSNEAGSSGAMDSRDINVKIGADDNNLNFHSGGIKDLYIFDVGLSTSQDKFLDDNPYFMYQIPEKLYGYAADIVEGNSYWYYDMLKRRN